MVNFMKEIIRKHLHIQYKQVARIQYCVYLYCAVDAGIPARLQADDL